MINAKRRFFITGSFVVAMLFVLLFMANGAIAKTGGADKETKTKTAEAYGRLPLSFIENIGQTDKSVRFYEKGAGHSTFFTKEGVYLQLVRGQKKENRQTKDGRQKTNKFSADKKAVETEIVKLIPLNANPNTQIIAEAPQAGKVNYLIGNDPKKWKTNIPTYGTVVYKDLYKGIDLKFYGNNQQMEYDIIVKPGGDPSQVKLSYEGVKGLKVTDNGDLEIALHSPSPLAGEGRGEGDKIIQKKPKIYQEINGKKVALEGQFKLSDTDSGPGNLNLKLKTENQKLSYTFEIASYNKAYPLIIDPVLVYSTYLGGSSLDYGTGIAVDDLGNAYVTGMTDSTNFPTLNPIQTAFEGSYDAFVTKINSAGNALVYSTYLGGSEDDEGYGIAVDVSGSAYMTGHTDSTDFPTRNPIQVAIGGGFNVPDAFVTKINSAGNALVYSTYLGGSGWDLGNGIAVDTSGNAYVTGWTNSNNFPTQNPIQAANGGGFNVPDAFVTKINSAGNALVYSTYLGGSDSDSGRAIAVDGAGNAYVTGGTASTDFPTLNPIQGAYGGDSGNAFVTKINSAGNALVYSTYLGGNGYDWSNGIAVDSSGNAYVTGWTGSTNFPTQNPIQGILGGGGNSDAFVTKINSAGNALVYSTYLGGSIYEEGLAIAVDASDNAYVTGYTQSTDFPTQNPIHGAYTGAWDAFVTKINSAGDALVYSTHLGGSSYNDDGLGIAVDGSGNTYVTGRAYSTDFPTCNPIQGAYGGGAWDAFVTKIGEQADIYTLTVNKAGTGTGTVTSSPAGINCGTDCSENYNYNTTVNLTATADSGSTFAGWSGNADCSDSSVIMDADKTCIATFNCNVSFTDVLPGYWAKYSIEEMYCRGITTGCSKNPLKYCPDDNVTRAQMSVFIIKGMGETTSLAAYNAYFNDIANDSFAPYINRMKELGITTGCGTKLYCPNKYITRAQMAVFIIKGLGATISTASYNANFDDIANDSFAPYINRMKELGITTGCGTRLYCPNSNATRAQMAVFLTRAFLQ